MIFEDTIINYFDMKLLKRNLKNDIAEVLSYENNLILEKFGLPHNILDFQFDTEIDFFLDSKIMIGKVYENEEILLDLLSGIILRNNDGCFLAKSLKNFFLQLYEYDHFWKVTVLQAKLGNYRENYKKYAFFLKSELLKIDSDLLILDNKYFWGAILEDIELGIVG